MFYGFNGSRGGKSEFTNVSEKTEIFIPSQQRYEIIIACITSLILLFVNVLLIGQNIMYYLILSALILSLIRYGFALKKLHTLSQINKIKKIISMIITGAI